MSVVLVKRRGKKAQEKRTLTAYYVSDEPIANSVLRQRLSKKLPNYMLPQQFMHLNQLPLTINGKLDQKALSLHSKEGQLAKHHIGASNRH